MRYQFRVNGRAAAPVRDRWDDAARDLVSAGYGVFVQGGSILPKIKRRPEAEIARVE